MQPANKTKSIDNHQIINAFYCVGMTGFEPATSRPQTCTLTGLSYIPNCACKSSAIF